MCAEDSWQSDSFCPWRGCTESGRFHSTVCAGQPCGTETAIHAIQAIYEEPDTEGVLWWMPWMRSTLWTDARLLLTSDDSAHCYRRCKSACTASTLRSFSLVVKHCCQGKAQCKVICSRWRYTGQWFCHLFAESQIIASRFGMQMMQLEEVALCSWDRGGMPSGRLVRPSFGYYPNAKKRGWLSKKSTSSVQTGYFTKHVCKSLWKVTVCSEHHWERY